MIFDILRKRKAVEVLLTLSRGAKGIREIQRAVGGSYNTVYARINEFLEANLIEQEYLTDEIFGKKPYDKRLIRLTAKGRELVQSLISSGFAKPLLLRKVRERWIIAVLHTLKTIYGRTRLMKLLFLLKNELEFAKHEMLGFYRFRSGKYGPFSRGVTDDLEELEDDAFIEVRVKEVSLGEFNEEKAVLHIYNLVPKQSDVVQEALDNLPKNSIQRLSKLKVFNRMPLIKLLKYVYTNYPNYIKNSDIVEKVLRDRSSEINGNSRP